AAIAAAAKPVQTNYDSAMVAGLPEIAQRYFNHAIAPGTALGTTVELAMMGSFVLGTAAKQTTFALSARQILQPPSGFVWIAEMKSGLMRMSGSDTLLDAHGSMSFFMFKALPLVRVSASEGLDRSAAVRPVLEAIWMPASLLPANGATWEQVGEDRAKISFGKGASAIEMTMTLAKDGRVIEVVAPRWSDANPQKVYQIQPFGGTMEEEATFAGFTIPSRVHVGNMFGTDAYLPFFNATITEARFY
ncbi:DUF6544 family protein, partial [Phaeovulum sp.]|uniref:DUF6544 family protein n=1 Tax=Phaeovulum sp. TaxID=2934796 RepID=UPI0035699D88